MSNILWRYYLEDDVERFRSLLEIGSYTPQSALKGHAGTAQYATSLGALGGSPNGGMLGTSPRTAMKTRKSSGFVGLSGSRGQTVPLTKADINSRDIAGLTILHRAVSSQSENSVSFAMALIDHPQVDLYIQDRESGWTALHRALYFGNITLARAIMARDSKDWSGRGSSGVMNRANPLFKMKDFEGNSPFDVYNATIARRTLQRPDRAEVNLMRDDEDDASIAAGSINGDDLLSSSSVYGDEIFAFGSNKNLTLGFGDGDDRQHPEKINLKRPDHLLQRFYREYLESRPITLGEPSLMDSQLLVGPVPVSNLPTLIRNRPIVVQDVALSKLHSAILTTDPEANLYICGFGPGGRLGTGDEATKFQYVCIEGGALEGKKITAIALGQNHSIALSSKGEVFTWGTNTWGQLGYTLPQPLKDEEPVNSTPRQIFGPLRREYIIGVAASGIHSVAYTSSSLYIWGKNEGQLGLMGSDARSLQAQPTPRKMGVSVFNAPIQMVSAVDRATICLLANHTVCVFTNYGYNNVKFPLYEGFTNYHLSNRVLTTQYDPEPVHIRHIASGGDTIAAISSRGDLFTVNVSQNLDPGPTASSTTNPAKIRNALSQPQRIWSLRKGNWDGIKSVDVAENGSVIICTQAGAVWRRIKRATVKDAVSSRSGGAKAKDYKFQRVPGLTKVAAVRSNTFGTYAAIRKDCDVTKTQIIVEEQALWTDLAPLLSLQGLEVSEVPADDESAKHHFRTPELPSDLEPMKRVVLMASDLEAAVEDHMRLTDPEEYDVEVGTTISNTTILAHSFMLAARSPFLRSIISEFRENGTLDEKGPVTVTSVGTRIKIELVGLDFLTLFNLVLYVYTDEVVDVWHFTRYAPSSAHRYRQVRTELMKVASKFEMTKLESAVRLMSEPQRHMHIDMALALQDPRFLEDGDAVIELDGGELRVHSALLRQRCPFFEGLFNGRAAGQWLASRRGSESEEVKIDMKHIEPSTFELVLRYLYSDIGSELFDEIVASNIDDFCDIVMDVMSVANELMLDRLSEICQQVIGRFVSTRNVCHLINAVAPCSVTAFKDAGLEYLCLQMEAMLENHLLDELDEDLLPELDEVVRANQLACLPFAKSGRAELELYEKHPELVEEIDANKQRMIRDLQFRAMKDDESVLSTSYRAKVGSLDDMTSASPSQDRVRRKSRGRNAPFSPAMTPKDQSTDLLFEMEDEDALNLGNPSSPRQTPADWSSGPSGAATPIVQGDEWHDVVRRKSSRNLAASPIVSPSQGLTAMSPHAINAQLSNKTPPLPSKPWSSPVLPAAKLDMREIMAQTSSGKSNLSKLLNDNSPATQSTKVPSTKMSQKERKKQQQQILEQTSSQTQVAPEKPWTSKATSSPWQIAAEKPKTPFKDVMKSESGTLSPLGQTVLKNSHGSPSPSPRRTASPDTRFSGQQRSNSGPSNLKQTRTSDSSSGPRVIARPSNPNPLMPHSKSYKTPSPKAEPALGLSMADIIGQQKREQDLAKEAVAKRSLQEIQEEQAFQEWWDKESRRTQEEEALRARPAGDSSRGKGTRRGRGGGQRGRGDFSRGGGRGRGRVSEAE